MQTYERIHNLLILWAHKVRILSHKALDKFLADKEYNIPSGIVLDNVREVYTKDNVTYMPIYYIMCIERAEIPEGDCIF